MTKALSQLTLKSPWALQIMLKRTRRKLQAGPLVLYKTLLSYHVAYFIANSRVGLPPQTPVN